MFWVKASFEFGILHALLDFKACNVRKIRESHHNNSKKVQIQENYSAKMSECRQNSLYLVFVNRFVHLEPQKRIAEYILELKLIKV